MDDHQTYRINAPAVAYQHVEDEAILIQFDSGCDYSTDRLGAEVLSSLKQEAGAITVVQILADRYCADVQTIYRAVKPFIGQLCAEKLVVAQPGDVVDGVPGGRASESTRSARGHPPIEPPVPHKYTDLQDLLLLDPIHDTDDAGWPIAEPNRWRAG